VIHSGCATGWASGLLWFWADRGKTDASAAKQIILRINYGLQTTDG